MRRNLDFDRYGLRFQPVKATDSGTYMCLLNNRREPDAPIVLTVQGRLNAKQLKFCASCLLRYHIQPISYSYI